MATNGYGSRSNNGSTNGEAVQETDRLHPRTNGYRESQSTETTALVDGNAAEGPRGNHRQSVQSFFFPKENPTIQRYYKFSATPMTPFAALHKRPGAGDAGGVTGLLRRSAVLPSHGTDPSGDWILVSVGGRSGWARRRRKVGDVGNFRMVKDFKAIEGWMGNHIFACGGKLMLGSDAPLFLFTNALIIIGVLVDLVLLLPQETNPWWLSRGYNYWATSILAVVALISLWISATMDPGIIPAVSSPYKPPPPPGPIGGPTGYRYCQTCNIFRPPRSKHCNSCNVCVSKFDQ